MTENDKEAPEDGRTAGTPTESDGYQPHQGREVVREQLKLELEQRFIGVYDPTLVFFDGEWHYPMTADTTFCDRSIPDPVLAVKNSKFSGPSTKACSECNPPVAGMAKRDIRRQILKHLEAENTNASGFSKDILEELLKIVEGHNRGEYE